MREVHSQIVPVEREARNTEILNCPNLKRLFASDKFNGDKYFATSERVIVNTSW